MARGSGITKRPAWLDVSASAVAAGQMEELLQTVGNAGVDIIRDNMSHRDDTGKTKGSVMWATAQSSGGAIAPDIEELEPPTMGGVCYIGSGEPNAGYIEYGTLAHSDGTDSAAFVAAIKEWAARNGIPDKFVGGIIRNIQQNGTDAHPYMKQSKMELRESVKQLGRNFLVKFIQAMGYKVSATRRR